MATHLTVTSTETLTPSLRRVWLRSDDLSAFAESRFTDRYVKLVFPKEGVVYPEPLDVRALRGVLPPEDMPAIRTYTALFPDVAAGTLAIDFVAHGDEGVAAAWALSAVPGDRLMANGPGGAYGPDPAADWHLLIGDESALPAITAALDALGDDAVVRVVALVESPAHELELPLPAKGQITFVHRHGDAATDASDTPADGSRGDADGRLEQAVRALEWLPGRVHVFAHGEAQEIMRRLRPHLFGERSLSRGQVSISGYWRRGQSEEGFRVWKSDLAREER